MNLKQTNFLGIISQVLPSPSRPGRLLDVLCTLNLRPVYTGLFMENMTICLRSLRFEGWFLVTRWIYDKSDLNNCGFSFIIYTNFGVCNDKLKIQLKKGNWHTSCSFHIHLGFLLCSSGLNIFLLFKTKIKNWQMMNTEKTPDLSFTMAMWLRTNFQLKITE